MRMSMRRFAVFVAFGLAFTFIGLTFVVEGVAQGAAPKGSGSAAGSLSDKCSLPQRAA
jgi:uncharacterized protein YjeT (DUF2065 family)